ncbi:MAG: DNA sulfur modification protein DndB [Gammaproteobacteria bacterium]
MKTDVAAVRVNKLRGLKQFETLPVRNLGARSWAATLTLEEFAQMADVANEARVEADLKTQRELFPKHAFGLARYLLKALVSAAVTQIEESPKADSEVVKSLRAFRRQLGVQPAFALQPFIVSIRKQDHDQLTVTTSGALDLLTISSKAKFWVIDGQHRLCAIRAVSSFLDSVQNHATYQPVRIGAEFAEYLFGEADVSLTPSLRQAWRLVQWQFAHCDVAANVFTDLEIEQERQLFHDLNNLGKSVEAGLAFDFDQSNPVNMWIKSELIPKLIKSDRVVNKDQKNWDEDQGNFVRKDLVAVNAFLFLRKTSVNGAEPRHVTPESCRVGMRFWEQMLAVPGMGQPGAKKKVVLAQPVVQKALALLINEFGMPRHRKAGKPKPARDRAMADRILSAIPKVDWSHSNPLWEYLVFAAFCSHSAFPRHRAIFAQGLCESQGRVRDIR